MKRPRIVKKSSYKAGFGKHHFWFTVQARNGKTLVTSEMYTTSGARDKGVDSLILTMGDPSLKVVELD